MRNGLRLIYVLCGNAAYNRGDRGNLLTQLRLLHEAWPGAQIVIDSYRPEVDSKWYDAIVIKRGFFLTWQQWQYLKRADVVVWGGGALIADNSCRTIIPYWLAVITLIKKVLRKPVMAWAHGLVVETKLGAVLAKLTLNQVDMITVRDGDSMRTLQRIGATRPPHYLTADPAMLIKPSSYEVGERLLIKAGVTLGRERKLVAISLTFWPFYHKRNDIIPYMFARKLGLRGSRYARGLAKFKKAVTELIDRLIERQSVDVILMPRYPSGLWDDLKHLDDIRQRSRYKKNVFIYQGDEVPPVDYLAMWRVFNLVISVALHDALFAIALNRPCVQLYYEPKGRDLADELEADDYMCDWSVLFAAGGLERIVDMADFAMSHSLDQKTNQGLEAMKVRAALNVDYLRAMVREKGFRA